jgi:RNA polymerase sigma factor (TIGR02999 family)
MSQPTPPPLDEMIRSAYRELKRFTHGVKRANFKGRQGLTRGTTDLLHDAVIRVIQNVRARDMNFEHFHAIAFLCVRNTVKDYIRRRTAEKRAGSRKRVGLEFAQEQTGHLESLSLEYVELLERLERVDPEAAEALSLKRASFTEEEAAELMEISVATFQRYLKRAREWLRKQLPG